MKRVFFIILLLACVPLAHAQYPWSGLIPSGTGIDWSVAGIPGGIPSASWTQCGATLSPTSGDQTSRIQAALTACGMNQFVLLAAGTFNINGQLLPNSNSVLRGSGANQTILNILGVSAPIALGTGGVSFSPIAITAGATAGSTSLTLASAPSVGVGGYIAVGEQNDGTTVSIQGGEGNCNWCDGNWTSNGLYASGQIVEITGVSGSVVTIFPGLYRAYTNSPVGVPFSAAAKYVGIEDLQILDNNTNANQDILLSKCAYCWVKGDAVNYTGGDWVDDYWGYRDEIRNNYFSNAYLHTSGNADADVSLLDKTSATLLANNIMERGHASILLSWGAAGNVVAYNYCEGGLDQNATNFLIGNIGMHGAHPQFNLFEGNVAPSIHPDQIWGSSAYNTEFRNWAEGATLSCLPLTGRGTVTCTPVGQYGGSGINGWWPYQASRAFDTDHLSTHYNFVGNVGGSAQQSALLPNGNPSTHVATLAWATTPPNPARSYDSTNYNFDFGYGESSDDGSVNGVGPGQQGCSGSTNPPCHSGVAFSTAFLSCNYTYADDATSTCPGGGIPASFFLSSQPSWWGSIPYPAIGPDVSSGPTGNPGARGHANLIPAQHCYFNVMGGSEGGPGSPLSFNENNCYTAGPPTVANPSISPSSGAYTSPQTITITDSTSGATLCYTSDGSTPTANGAGTCTHGTTYSVPFSQSLPITIKAIGSKSGSTDSGVTSNSYTVGYFVQAASGFSTSSATLAVAFSSPTTAADLLVVGFDFPTGSTLSSIVDSQGNSFAQVGTQLNASGGFSSQVWYAKNTIGGADTVTITFTTSVSEIEGYPTEYAGLSTTNPVDGQAGAVGAAGAVSSGNITTTVANDLIYGFCMVNGACTVGAGFTARATLHNNLVEDSIAGSSGTYSATATATGPWAIQGVAFKPSGSPSSRVPGVSLNFIGP